MKFIPYVIILGLLFVCFYQWKNPKIETIETIKIERDTIIEYDTVYKEKPVPITVTKVQKDTVYVNDTIYLVLDKEEKFYTDSSTYELQISGINADLDWIKTFPKQTTIYEEKVVQIAEKQPLFEFKPAVGFGFGITTKKPDIWVGGSLTVNINRKKK